MKNIIIALILIASSFSISFGQSNDRFVKVGDTVINLSEIEVEKGFEICNKQIHTSPNDREIVYLQSTIYKSYGDSHYLIVNDTSTLIKGEYDSSQSSFVEVFDSVGSSIFTVCFPELSIGKCRIAPKGNLIAIKLGSMDREEIHLYDGKGNLIGIYEIYDTEIESSYLNSIITITKEKQETNSFITDFYFNGSLFNKQLSFKEKPIIYFSSNEKIIIVRDDGLYKLYDLNLELREEISFAEYHVYVFNNGKHYTRLHRVNRSYEVREMDTDKLLFSKDTISYNGVSEPIYYTGTVNRGKDRFYSAYFGSVLVFNFYDINGNFINTDTTSSSNGLNRISFYKDSTGYKIAIKNEY